MSLHEFTSNVVEGWTTVALIILALMVFQTVREEWVADDGSRFEAGIGLALIVLGIYLGGFR
jgi:heme A synthase